MITSQIKNILIIHYPLELPISASNKLQIKLLNKFIFDKRNSSLGDSLTNFAYSCAKTLVSGFSSSNKVPDKMLIQGYENSNLKNHLALEGKKKKIGNNLEALILLVWIFDLLTLEELIERLREEMTPEMFKSSLDEQRIAIKSFTRLFNIINNLILQP